MSTRSHRSSRRRGFTLVELLIAMASGLVVATAALMLARNASRFFQHEARFSAAHLGAMLGMGRLTTDIQRAAFLASPNVRVDSRICGDKTGWPEGMKRLAGITIRKNGSYAAHTADLVQSEVNGLRPDSVIIGGAFGTNELFDVQGFRDNGGAGWSVTLQEDSFAMGRTLARAAEGGPDFQAIFRAGRLLRIGTEHNSQPFVYGVISGIQQLGPRKIEVRLEPIPALPDRVVNKCGISSGSASNSYANPVSRVLYEIRSLKGHPQYGPLVASISPEVTGDDGRTELVRVELDAYNNEIPETLELISEYAVDLKFGISTSVLDGAGQPVVQRYAIEDALVYSIAEDIFDNNGDPQIIRSVQVRMSTRTRAPDRDVGLEYMAGGQPRRLRFLIPGVVPGVGTLGDPIPAGAPPVFARMRTLHAEVALANQEVKL